MGHGQDHSVVMSHVVDWINSGRIVRHEHALFDVDGYVRTLKWIRYNFP
jgi:hypothetical protein